MRRDDTRRRSEAPAYQMELGSKSLLSLFFALAIVCGMFFAFGYTMGKHAIPATFRLGETAQAPAFANTPAAVPGVQAPNPSALGAAETNQTPAALTASAGAGSGAPATTTSASGAANGTNVAGAANETGSASGATTTSLPQSISAAAANVAPPPAIAAGSGAGNSSGSFYQIQVFSGVQADAQSLASALQSRGYPVSLVPPVAGQSNLYLVQVGPYLTQAEAQATSARLTADGYQAVIKTQ